MAFHIKIGNYRFSKNLGTGSFGKVKLAFNEVTGHKVAIKILNKKKIKQQGVFEKVKREIKVLRQFNHPHIIKHYEFIDTPSDIFMVIEFASGGELFDLISRRERLPEEEARRFFQQIYSSIEYTHAHKIAHRDLKPENLLLDEYNNIKLIDFGLANSMKDSQALKTACGSPNYAAPEVISGRSYSGVEIDVWSLGVILFAMVCGSLPFDADSMSVLFNQIKEGRYYMPNFISADVEDLINRMLQPNPVKRITMKEIKEHPWYLKNLPQYLQDLSKLQAKQAHEIDQDIVAKLFQQLNINLQGRSEEEICKAIKDKKNTDFCGIYELYYHDKMKKECFKIQHQYDDDPYTTGADDLGNLAVGGGHSQLLRQESTVSSQTSKIKHFKTVKHLLMHQEEDKPNKSASKELITTYSLLKEKHQDRLSRIIKKFRTGTTNTHKSDNLIKQLEQPLEVMPGSRSQVSTQVETSVVATPTQQHQQIQAAKSSHSEQFFIHRQPHPRIKQWVFGLIFKGTPIDLMTLTCEVLKQLDFEWQIIPKDLKMKCRSKIDENSVNEYEQSLLMDGGYGDDLLAHSNKDELIKEFLRKNFLKFYINIYKVPPPAQPSTHRAKTSTNSGGVADISGASNSSLEDGSGGSRLCIH